ncbi:hypothetical protein [Paenibacillus sp. FSL R5-0810]|uniref:hypothetical protein n=1 Tax=Paenibacillus sp. FSL R5-0810 TaxID=2921659 RepID=UPI0030F71554
MKKMLTLALAMVMILSLSVSAFANPVEEQEISPPGTSITVRPLTPEEITLLEQRANGNKDVSLFDVGILSDSWSGNVTVPVNKDGNQGANVGHAFVPSPDRYVLIYVGDLPSTMPSVNLSIQSQTNSNVQWWRSNIKGNSLVVIDTGSYNNHTFRIKTSTNEANSRSACFEWATSSDY